MGAKLEQIYDLVTKKAGLKGRMRLAVKTGVSRIKAAEQEDTDKVLAKFKSAATDILGQEVNDLL